MHDFFFFKVISDYGFSPRYCAGVLCCWQNMRGQSLHLFLMILQLQYSHVCYGINASFLAS